MISTIKGLPSSLGLSPINCSFNTLKCNNRQQFNAFSNFRKTHAAFSMEPISPTIPTQQFLKSKPVNDEK